MTCQKFIVTKKGVIRPVYLILNGTAVISSSKLFPQWQGDFVVGSLKARSLFRFEIHNNTLVARETLLEGLAPIRDVEQGYNCEIYLLLEHNSGGRILKLVPEG
jgi:glucose/arabinose dehydrogenase